MSIPCSYLCEPFVPGYSGQIRRSFFIKTLCCPCLAPCKVPSPSNRLEEIMQASYAGVSWGSCCLSFGSTIVYPYSVGAYTTSLTCLIWARYRIDNAAAQMKTTLPPQPNPQDLV